MEALLVRPEDLYDPETKGRIDRAEVEPHCAKCKAPLKIVRQRGEPLGAIIQISCTKNENHRSTHYHLAPLK